MILLIGLGNPGKAYEGTRHNVGREIVLAFAKKHEVNAFAPHKKIKGLVTECKIQKENYALVLPETFMNKSGQAAKEAKLVFKTEPEKIFVVHDDADIELGRTKLLFGRDSAGHKGVESVMRALATKDFWRFRIGIGGERPRLELDLRRRSGKKIKHVAAESLVLKKFSPAEEALMKKVRAKTIGALGDLANTPPEHVMNHYNK
ncbi:MAG: aminoacyl-tRNA hydrolase [Candidatus Sungbacteria bacterium]|uniref:Aminoacyl-tRNA hydrolase n=1 Tax=Candidatus Sungiibacteriota bacterium TaxID=2750080 RepID=A0A9D6LS52_9BACT|nr:aminoacyl-tRNA hydrolase [Candidatus Sungbacteria bacterium]